MCKKRGWDGCGARCAQPPRRSGRDHEEDNEDPFDVSRVVTTTPIPVVLARIIHPILLVLPYALTPTPSLQAASRALSMHADAHDTTKDAPFWLSTSLSIGRV